MYYKLGIDVGGTNTDAVLIDEQDQVLSEIKSPTSEDIYSGIIHSIRILLQESHVDPSQIRQAMLGTTQCTNAIVERKNLAPMAILRIGAPATVGILPMTDWDETLSKVCVDYEIIRGGYEYDGKELSPFDEDAARAFFRRVNGKVKSIAIIGVFSNVRPDQELLAASIAREELGNQVHLSLSHEIGTMGLIERENATILNAMLFEVSRRFTDGFALSLKQEGITEADVYLSQNDGTLMTMEQAQKYPILTIACGPTNSIRGASYLSSLKNAIVVDVGGTTTDLGVIKNGFPRESSSAVSIGGVRTNFRMPDVLSIGLGGGSIVRTLPDGSITVGPDSVGYRITEHALVFGGDTITATDIAVRLGMADIGDSSLVSCLDLSFALKAMDCIHEIMEDAIDAMKLSDEPVPVILVGGGSIIIPEHLSGTAKVIKPQYFGVANAIGSAISKVSGTYDGLADYLITPREIAIEEAKRQAIHMAIEAGALPDTVEIVEIEDVPLAYHPGQTSRLKIKAAGDLR